jgi:2-polyprenyl-3-methyl-5-hydroxy-6-metoxy-1,4-benzoquinol methylase
MIFNILYNEHMKKTYNTSIIKQVNLDYYQNGVRTNIFQKLWHRGRLRHVHNLIDIHIDHAKPLKVLDVGCSSGWFLSRICSRYSSFKATGVDVYKDAILYASKLYPHITFQYADVHSLPFRKNSFDIVLCTNVLEHVKEPKLVLSEIRRVMRPDGTAFIGMDSENLLFSIVWYVWVRTKGGIWKGAHLYKYREGDLDDLYKSAGFKIAKKIHYNYTMALMHMLKKNNAIL